MAVVTFGAGCTQGRVGNSFLSSPPTSLVGP